MLWGDPRAVPWMIVGEGPETMAAVAYAFRSEIESGKVCVASAMTAGGLKALKLWPGTRRLTIAADRDEEPKPGKAKASRTGERSAQLCGVRHHAKVEIHVAMPGEPGSTTDWLDVLRQSGVEAVRDGILAASRFVPTPDEIEVERQRQDGAAELQAIGEQYPLPALDGMHLAYRRAKNGRVKLHKRVRIKGQDGEERFEHRPIATPFGVVARLRYADRADAYGLRIVVQAMDGKPRNIDVDRASFARQGATETRATLFDAGLRVEEDGEMIAVKLLKAADPDHEVVVVQKPGWQALDGFEERFFVCPDGRVIGAPEGSLAELSVNARISPRVSKGGTLQGWKDAVSAAVLVRGCEHWAIGAIAGFAAPLIALTGLDTCGINLSGVTSSGKTTAQRLAVSAWSKAASDQRDSLLQTAKATVNGIEVMASRSTGTVLAMDELGHVNGMELQKIIYGLASGIGRQRMTADATPKPSHTWATFVILSAEKSLEEKIRGDGGEWFGGMAVRIPDIDVTGVNRAVDLAMLEQIRGVEQHYGHAGPAFIQALIEAGHHRRSEEIRASIYRSATKIAGPDASSAATRAALPFAILTIAGAMACDFGLLPQSLDVVAVVRWAWARFQNSTDAVALDPEVQAVTNLRAWVAERWNSSIYPTLQDSLSRPSRDACGWYDERAVYILAHRLVEAAGGALKETEIGRALKRQGLLVATKDKDCFFISRIPGSGQKVKAYALSRSEFGRAIQGEASFTVYEGGRA